VSVNWEQLRTVLWLRWRLTRNQWARHGQINAVITLLVVVVGLCCGVAGGIGGFLGGALGLGQATPLVLMLVWDGLIAVFLMFWMIGLVSELQRSELIDLGRLLHLPVSLREVFVLNYVSSFLSLSLALLAPAMFGLAAGLVVSRGWAMLLLFPLVLGFFFSITAWTYCLRGWLASLMVNQRRRRAIIMGITLTCVLLGQLPNLLINGWRAGVGRSGPASPAEGSPGATATPGQGQDQARVLAAAVLAHKLIPLLWLPYGARALAEGQGWPALGGAGGLLALGAWGLRRAFRATLRFHQGSLGGQPARKPRESRPKAARKTLLVERELPWLPKAAAAVALANLRSILRAPEIKMALALNVFIFGIMGASILLRGPTDMPPAARYLAASAAVVVTFLGLLQVLFNQFGFDRDAFRALVLGPARREHVLLGKNLSFLPLALAAFLAFLALVTVLAHLPAAAIVSACFQFGAAFLTLSVVGNLASILVPYRIAAGSLKPTKTKATTAFTMVLVQMFFPLVGLPILLPAGLGLLCEHMNWCAAAPVNLVLSVLLAGLAALAYWQALMPLGRLLQRREQKILEKVTEEVE
jgi:ABC-2 type transport system permease protein